MEICLRATTDSTDVVAADLEGLDVERLSNIAQELVTIISFRTLLERRCLTWSMNLSASCL